MPQRTRTRSPRPHSLANADTLSGKLAKASLLGEGWGTGGLTEAINRISYESQSGETSRPPS